MIENPENEKAQKLLDYYLDADARRKELESDPEWQKDNMEYDLRTSEYMIEKVRSDDVYAQNLYAAMCNNDFQRNEVWPILSGKTWSCSWRYAGGIVADMKGEGDYIDWYCSGIRNSPIYEEVALDQLNIEERQEILESQRYVSESTITDEIRDDLFKLGWKPVGDNNEF